MSSTRLSFVTPPVKKPRKCKKKLSKSSIDTSAHFTAKKMIDVRNSRFMKTKTELNYALWKHIVSLLVQILLERPETVVESFEQLSKYVKENCSLEVVEVPDEGEDDGYDMVSSIIDLENDSEYLWARRYMELMKSTTINLPIDEDRGEGGEGEEDDANKIKFDVSQQIRRFEQAGIALPSLDCFHINLAMRRLVETNPIAKIRFWGIIYGLRNDYYVVECEMKPEEIARRREELKRFRFYQEKEIIVRQVKLCRLETWKPTFVEPRNETEQKLAIVFKKSKLKKYKPPPLPVITPAPFLPIPQERPGEGCNRKVFFVANDPKQEWTMLPDVQPKHIIAARKVKNYFVGNLSCPVNSWLGSELESEEVYLRAQIARISAGTQISPLGFYTFGEGEGEEEEEEEEEEGGPRGPKYKKYTQNRDFQPIPLRDLADPAMSFWVHHTDHVLRQGRALWVKLKPPKEPGEGEGEEEKEEQEGEGEGEGEEYVEPEIGPPLLTPLSEDATQEGIPPWTVRVCPKYLPKKYAFVRSNLWPGACTYASSCDFDNIYIGWGIKYQRCGFPVSTTPVVQTMYDLGPDVLEAFEPTLEMEEQWYFNNIKPKPPDDLHLGEGEGEGEGGGIPDEDEDDE